MFHITNNLTKLSISRKINFVNLEILRWRRKPRWLPVAKSKMFKIPPRTITPPEESEELRRLYNNYRTQIKSIRRFLTYEYSSKLMNVDPEFQAKVFEEDFAKCNEINNKWNEDLRISREARVARELEHEKEIALQRLVDRTEIQQKLLEEAEQTVREQKEQARTFITPDKLDAALEYALANPVDYNFAIDMDGNIISGRETKPPIKPIEK